MGEGLSAIQTVGEGNLRKDGRMAAGGVFEGRETRRRRY
jgi:hypothetical protein